MPEVRDARCSQIETIDQWPKMELDTLHPMLLQLVVEELVVSMWRQMAQMPLTYLCPARDHHKGSEHRKAKERTETR